MRKQATTSTIRNSTCRTVGHDWKLSIGQTYRTCTRVHCKAAERLVGGTWTPLTCLPRSRAQRQTTLDVVALSSLWTTPLHETRDNMPSPGYDRQRERQAEQRYYKAIADDHYYRATHAQHTKGGR